MSSEAFARTPTTERIAAVILLIVAWLLVTALIANPAAFPGPWDVLTKALPTFAILDDRPPSLGAAIWVILQHLSVTTARAAVGLFIGLSLGLCIGVPAGLYRHSLLQGVAFSTIAALKNLPLFAFIPLFVYWFSGSAATIVGYVAFASFLLTAPAAAAAAAALPRRYLELASTLGTSDRRLLRLVAPPLLTGLLPSFRWNVALMWAFSLGAEYAGSPALGMGSLAYQAYLWSDVGRMMVVALVYLVAGSLSLVVFDALSRLAAISKPKSI